LKFARLSSCDSASSTEVYTSCFFLSVGQFLWMPPAAQTSVPGEPGHAESSSTDGGIQVPILTTNRLLLAPHQLSDFEPLSAMWSDPEVVRQISGRPSSLTDSWMRLLRYRGLWPLLGYGYWAIRERDTGRYVGDIGFADFYRDIQPSIRGIPEAGWVLARWAHGRGYATEALTAACAWLDRQERHERSVCIVTPENGASVRVAEKAGFAGREEREIKGQMCWLMTRPVRKCLPAES
jgi:RimJ/RimL family protein N-acetyltransferase